MEFTSEQGEQQYAEVVRSADSLVVGLDFDGTLSPIVEDPEHAHIHDDAPGILVDLAGHVRAIAVVTGRPARQVLALGGLDEVGDALGEGGRELFVFGQYGNERWSSHNRRVISPRPPHGLASFLRELPRVLRREDAGDAYVEEKGLAVAVHTRRMADPGAAFRRLLPALTELARRHELVVEPGRNVIEVRSPGMHKGAAVDTLVEEQEAGAFVFIGDDLGDVDAFQAVLAHRKDGMPTLLVCSGSDEESALVDLADAVVDGPDGVLGFLRTLMADIDAARS
ncbi:trehalose-phosphatase [Nocardioides guangzhouensis]|uniref:Trehalose 6-phosphate phosphatase n=1 Tax=Nocardioides guangzhouensis TaxID=2497878 RepID=A0A4Q4Z8I6_9ACTN|nr:trehalose-phosphatase [Nocardioides guangzhouensis]RYP83511.1 trehalose-phosphatase [Nocardioides guangzhouensis]